MVTSLIILGLVDFIKMTMGYGYDKVIANHPELDFYYDINPVTGEIRSKNVRGKTVVPCRMAYDRNMRFRVFDNGRVIIDGSLHKYWNDGMHNCNDFSIEAVKEVLQQLLVEYSIAPQDVMINQLEIGLNISVTYPIGDILQCMFFHRKAPFLWCDTHTEGNYFQARHEQYRLKVYDKGLQEPDYFKAGTNMLRYEVNYLGSKLRRDFGLFTVQDLQTIPFVKFIDAIRNELELILFYDFTIDHYSRSLLNYNNRNYWQKLIDEKRTSAYNKHKKKLNEHIRCNSENVLCQISRLLEKKAIQLTSGGVSINDICIDLTSTPQEQYSEIYEQEDGENLQSKKEGRIIRMSRENGLRQVKKVG